MLRFLSVVMLIPFPILNSLNDCLEFGVHYSFCAEGEGTGDKWLVDQMFPSTVIR